MDRARRYQPLQKKGNQVEKKGNQETFRSTRNTNLVRKEQEEEKEDTHEEDMGKNSTKEVIKVELTEAWKQELSFSYTVYIHEDLGADSLQEILQQQGYRYLKIVKIQESKFIFTFFDSMDISNMQWEMLHHWISSYSATVVTDMVKTRMVWLIIFGLPYIAFRDEILHLLIGDYGDILRKGANCFRDNVLVMSQDLYFQKKI